MIEEGCEDFTTFHIYNLSTCLLSNGTSYGKNGHVLDFHLSICKNAIFSKSFYLNVFNSINGPFGNN